MLLDLHMLASKFFSATTDGFDNQILLNYLKGGSGNINLMIHLRGHKHDFDRWANVTNDTSWSHEGVVPFFKAHEDYRGPGDGKDIKFHF